MSFPVNFQGLPTEVLEEVFTPENKRVRPTTNSLSSLSFPKSRCALWDCAPTGDKVQLHLYTHRPPCVQLMEKALRLAQRHSRHSSRARLNCFFIGCVSVDSDEAGVTVTLDRFDPGRDQNGVRVPSAVLPGDICASCVFTSDPNTPNQSEPELQQAFKTLQQSVVGRQSLDLSQILRLRLDVVWTQALDSADFNISWSCVSPATSVHAEPIRAVTVIPTALFRSLTSSVRPSASSRQRGFVTMDQTRKLLLLLESDPKALSLPLVGVWFSGAAQVHSPQIWAWTLRFLHSSSIQDRVFSESGCFLLVLFGSTHRTPQFFQCRRKGSGPELQFQLLTGHQTATLYQQVASVEGQTLKCDLKSETDSRELAMFRRAHQAFHSSPVAGLSVTDQDSGVEDEDLSPRPSPSPHLPPPQTRRIQPSVPELSLLIDSSFSSNHNTSPPAPRHQAPPPSSDRKCASPLQLHSTPHSNLQPQTPPCVCCNSNNHVCTTIHATSGTDLLQVHQKTPQYYQHTTTIPQNSHPNPSSNNPSPSGHCRSPLRQFTSQSQSQRTPPFSKNDQPVFSRSVSLPEKSFPQLPSIPQQSPNYHTPIQTALENIHPSPSNPAQNQPVQELSNIHHCQYRTPPMPSHQATVGRNSLHFPATNMDSSMQNISQTPPRHCTRSNLVAANQHSSPSQEMGVPLFTCGSPKTTFPASSPSPAGRCCEQQVALSSGEAYQLLLQQDRQLQLLQQQVQMLLEVQSKLQTQQQTESQTQTKSTASIAVGTGASLFWPDPPPHRDSSSSPPPPSVAPVQGAGSSPHSLSPLSTASPTSRPQSHDQTPRPEPTAERDTPTMEASCSPVPSQSGLSSVESPVLGESASMYRPEEPHQENFYHSLMTQLNSRLQEDEETHQDEEKSKLETAEEEVRIQTLDRPPSPAHSSHSSSARPSSQVQSSSTGQVFGPTSGSKRKKQKPISKDLREQETPSPEDVVLNATLRRLHQLGVRLDKGDLSESDRAKTRAVESVSTLACINPAAVVSRLSVPDPSLSSFLPHSSADLSLEANAIALRYLSDQQLSRLALSGRTQKPAAKPSSDITILSPNNMSLATRKYMRKYGLIEEESEGEEDAEEEEKPVERQFRKELLPQSQLIRELKPKMKLLAGHGQRQNGRDDEEEEDKENTAMKREVIGSQGSVGNILDLSRLRQLPKLF